MKETMLRNTLENINQFEYIAASELSQAEKNVIKFACAALGWEHEVDQHGDIVYERR